MRKTFLIYISTLRAQFFRKFHDKVPIFSKNISGSGKGSGSETTWIRNDLYSRLRICNDLAGRILIWIRKNGFGSATMSFNVVIVHCYLCKVKKQKQTIILEFRIQIIFLKILELYHEISSRIALLKSKCKSIRYFLVENV